MRPNSHFQAKHTRRAISTTYRIRRCIGCRPEAGGSIPGSAPLRVQRQEREPPEPSTLDAPHWRANQRLHHDVPVRKHLETEEGFHPITSLRDGLLDVAEM